MKFNINFDIQIIDCNLCHFNKTKSMTSLNILEY